jgi:glycerophosphoryl diester phosphodiesterase
MFLKIGHRGAMGYEPENTLRSFKKALSLGVDMVELDVYVCKTGEVVVFHDDKLKRTTNGRGYVFEKTFEELRVLDAGKGEEIPTLQEVLDLVNRTVKVNIELKGEKTAEPVSKIIEVYVNEKGWSHDDFLVSSFNHDELEKFHSLNPQVKIGVLIDSPFDYTEIAKRLNAYSVNPPKEMVTKEFVDSAHNRGLKVFVWTVNEPEGIAQMKAFRVNGAFSNYPDRL